MWLNDFFKRIGEYLGWEPKPITNTNPEKKKFLIKESSSSNRRFRIIGEKKLPPKKKGKISILNESRPRKCPLCKSSGTMSKNEKGDGWLCDTSKGGCGHKLK